MVLGVHTLKRRRMYLVFVELRITVFSNCVTRVADPTIQATGCQTLQTLHTTFVRVYLMNKSFRAKQGLDFSSPVFPRDRRKQDPMISKLMPHRRDAAA